MEIVEINIKSSNIHPRILTQIQPPKLLRSRQKNKDTLTSTKGIKVQFTSNKDNIKTQGKTSMQMTLLPSSINII